MRKKINIKTVLTVFVGATIMDNSLLALDIPQQFSNDHRYGQGLNRQNPMRGQQVQVDLSQQQIQATVCRSSKQLSRARKIANALREKEEAKQKAALKAANKIREKLQAKAIKEAKREAKNLAQTIRMEAKRLVRVAALAKKTAQVEAKRLAKVAALAIKTAQVEAKRLAKVAAQAKKVAQAEAKRLVKAAEKARKLAREEAKLLAKAQCKRKLNVHQAAALQEAAFAQQPRVFHQLQPDQEILTNYGTYNFYAAGTPDSHKSASQIYNLSFPKAPVFHQYDIDGNMRTTDGMTPVSFRAPLFFRLPSTQVDRLSAVLGSFIPENISRENIDLMVMVQNMPWEQGTPILYRPHYYLEPNAPYFGTYEHNQAITSRCVPYVGHAVSFSKQQMIAATHPQGAAGVHSQILLSGAAPDSIVLNGVDNQQSSLFFTILSLGDRLAITLHALLNDTDHHALEAQLGVQTYGNVTEILEGPLNNLGENPVFQSLKAFINE